MNFYDSPPHERKSRERMVWQGTVVLRSILFLYCTPVYLRLCNSLLLFLGADNVLIAVQDSVNP